MAELGDCVNCGHALYFDPSTKQLHHFTRSFHSWGYPYSDLKCYAGQNPNHCGCEKPVTSNIVLLKEIQDSYGIQIKNA